MSKRLFSSKKKSTSIVQWSITSLVVMVAVFAGLIYLSPSGDAGPMITVYKSRTCGCCAKWISHLQDSGFDVLVRNHDDLPEIKKQYGIQPELAACHTGLVDGYLVEGHVPADIIKRLLKEHPSIDGIAVPGMPIGSPGMEGPNPEPYQILAFDADGNTSVYDMR